MTRLISRRILRVALPCLVALSITGRASAILIRDDVPDSSYLAFATQFTAVGKVLSGREDGLIDLGSGTLIGTRWVVTAAHVVEGVRPSLSFRINGVTYSAQPTSIIVNPAYYSIGDAYTDIAIFRLDVMPPIQPAPIFDGKTELGQTVAMVGYGTTGVGSTGIKSAPFVLRAGTNIVDIDTTGRKYLAADFDAPPGYVYRGGESPLSNGTPTPLEALQGHGDSGGGWFINQNGQWALAGVIEGNLSYPEQASHQRSDDPKI